MSGSAVSVRNTNETVDPKPLIPPSESEGTKKVEIQPWGGTTKGKIKRSKPRLGGGWGCCLDCAAGENRELYPWEVSETAIFLLRELIGTLSQNQDFESRIRSFLHSQLKVFY